MSKAISFDAQIVFVSKSGDANLRALLLALSRGKIITTYSEGILGNLPIILFEEKE